MKPKKFKHHKRRHKMDTSSYARRYDINRARIESKTRDIIPMYTRAALGLGGQRPPHPRLNQKKMLFGSVRGYPGKHPDAVISTSVWGGRACAGSAWFGVVRFGGARRPKKGKQNRGAHHHMLLLKH